MCSFCHCEDIWSLLEKKDHTHTHTLAVCCVSQTETDRCSMPYVDLVKKVSPLAVSLYYPGRFQVSLLQIEEPHPSHFLSFHSHIIYMRIFLSMLCIRKFSAASHHCSIREPDRKRVRLHYDKQRMDRL